MKEKAREGEAYGRRVPRILGYTSYVAQLRDPKRAIVPRDEVFLLLLLPLLLLFLFLFLLSSHPFDGSYFVACHPDNFGNFDGRLIPCHPRLIALQDQAIGIDFPSSFHFNEFLLRYSFYARHAFIILFRVIDFWQLEFILLLYIYF